MDRAVLMDCLAKSIFVDPDSASRMLPEASKMKRVSVFADAKDENPKRTASTDNVEMIFDMNPPFFKFPKKIGLKNKGRVASCKRKEEGPCSQNDNLKLIIFSV